MLLLVGKVGEEFYSGDWQENKRHGQGRYTSFLGQTILTDWKDDKSMEDDSRFFTLWSAVFSPPVLKH